jgi:hypothetical protein
MGEPIAVLALRKTRDQISRAIAHYQRLLREAEQNLAHIDENKVRGAYNAANYLKHRARMLQWWADLVDQ